MDHAIFASTSGYSTYGLGSGGGTATSTTLSSAAGSPGEALLGRSSSSGAFGAHSHLHHPSQSQQHQSYAAAPPPSFPLPSLDSLPPGNLSSSHSSNGNSNNFFTTNHTLQSLQEHEQQDRQHDPRASAAAFNLIGEQRAGGHRQQQHEMPAFESSGISPGSVGSGSLDSQSGASGRPRKDRRRGGDDSMGEDESGGSSVESAGEEVKVSVMVLPPLAKKRGRPVGSGNNSAKGKGKARAKKVAAGAEGGEIEDDSSEFEGKKLKGAKRKATGDKKKKAGRACATCQKAHLTCDDARPCARCIKKGCQDSCHDGARKKAKYLQEIPDELLERRQGSQTGLKTEDSPNGGDSGDSPSGLDNMLSGELNPPPFSFETLPYYDNQTFANEFGSEAANLEYAILSSMLNGNGFSVDEYGMGGQDPRLSGSANGSTMLINSPPMGGTLNLAAMEKGNTAPSSVGAGGGGGGGRPAGGAAGAGGPSFASIFERRLSSSAPSPGAGGLGYTGPNSLMSSPARLHDPTSPDFYPSATASAVAPPDLSAMRSTSGNNVNSNAFAGEQAAGGGGGGGGGAGTVVHQPVVQHLLQEEYPGRTAQPTKMLTAEEAYRCVTKPYPYAQSYHYLVRHLKDRFEKNDILRIIRALATFRPSLIALQMPLTEEDETFVERTFQRTLVELNKLISFSGTPTVVWRRTGEICLVGTEFCLLTGWSREELLGKKYIFELFDTASVVEYYESFAKHAFESTSSSVMTQCVVLGPSGRPVPCAFCFSVRRDLFSCPFLVIGSFLPVLV